jgi:hypothetical protein
MLILFSLFCFIALEPLLHQLSLDIYHLMNVDCEVDLLVSTISDFVEEKLCVAKKAKQEHDVACNEFAEQRHQFIAEASAGLKIFLQDAAMEKLMAKAATPDKAEWQKKTSGNCNCGNGKTIDAIHVGNGRKRTAFKTCNC